MLKKCLIGWVLGCCLAAWTDPLWIAALLLVPLLRRSAPWLALPAGALAGALWFQLHLDDYLSHRSLIQDELALLAVVDEFPQQTGEAARFAVRSSDSSAPLRLRLSWLEPDFQPAAGDLLQLQVRARPPRGLANPGGFDMESWAFVHGIHGTGYVQSGRRLGMDDSMFSRLLRRRAQISHDLRARISDPTARDLLPALAVADRRAVSDVHWAVLAATGTSHLLAISGLHIGLVAGMGFALAALLWRLAPGRWTRRGMGFALALPMATSYAAMAGFSLSTVRALVMLVTLALMYRLRTRVTVADGLLLAATVVFLIDPAAPVAPGFWLSFGAVAVLAVVGLGQAPLSAWQRAGRAQLAVALGLLPITAALGMVAGPSAPLVNLLAIPWVGILVVPPLLLAVALGEFLPQLADLLLIFAARALEWLWWGLERIAGMELMAAASLSPRVWQLPFLLLGIAVLAMPRGLPGRPLALILVAAGLWTGRTPPPPGSLDLHVLDVGQGLALLVETHQHRLLYDLGPASRSGWDAGSAVVAPFLNRRGHREVQMLMISHADTDHAGGWRGLDQAELGFDDILSSAPDRHPGSRPCLRGESWEWDGVGFEILHPSPGLPYLGNDSSCVLLISAGQTRLLLPGDISEAVEARLSGTLGRLDALVVAHHGSKSSSAAGFIAETRPRWAIYSAGYHNRYGMPHPEVMARLASARALSTAACGYLRLRVDPEQGVRLLHSERAGRTRPWQRFEDDADENQYDCAS